MRISLFRQSQKGSDRFRQSLKANIDTKKRTETRPLLCVFAENESASDRSQYEVQLRVGETGFCRPYQQPAAACQRLLTRKTHPAADAFCRTTEQESVDKSKEMLK